MGTNNNHPTYDEFVASSQAQQAQVAATLVGLPLTEDERIVLCNDFANCSPDVRIHSIEMAFKCAITRMNNVVPDNDGVTHSEQFTEDENTILDMLGCYITMAQTFHEHGPEAMPALMQLLEMFSDGHLAMQWAFDRDPSNPERMIGRIAYEPTETFGGALADLMDRMFFGDDTEGD